ncbi:Yippee zinc-binding/DNA-binding /Mis18 centromere assembly family protein [Babesia bovis T2Bo]|uniref:Yippee zinc-binding/DNA-binding /Mis18 centromere assembly family protein n=1 Tax=Babesia bovis T2Bo TaxID=484906 RepID=UPI001C350F39|nr:Yippee zinc-binding/DNA-binding /Mis18 centromere assembly family protein [Babesia bovis T2Bo]EDO08655.2 Yippee zinc-binding/DNA-binding /Mis18 centromere assembly family protein [Babesia bovis T2Bo]
MGQIHEFHIDGETLYCCAQCSTPLASSSHVLSKSFRGRTGGAWLFSRVYNVTEGDVEERMMNTGQHSITDVYCNGCGTNLGWKYYEANHDSQRYKCGKVILEKHLLLGAEDDDSESSEDSSTSDME